MIIRPWIQRSGVFGKMQDCPPSFLNVDNAARRVRLEQTQGREDEEICAAYAETAAAQIADAGYCINPATANAIP